MLLFGGRLLPAFVFIIVSVIYSRQLSLSTYGTFQTVWMFVNIAGILLSFGVPTLLLSYPQISINYLKQKYRSQILTAAIALCITTAAVLVANKAMVNGVLWLCVLLFLLQAAVTVAEALLIRKGESLKLAVINAAYAVLFLAWHLYQLNNFSITLLLIGNTALLLLRLVVFSLFINKVKEVVVYETFDVSRHWMYLGLNDVLGVFAKWIDKLVLVYFVSAADFAVLFTGTYEVPFIGLLVGAAGSILTVHLANNSLNKEESANIFKEGFLFLSAIVFPLFFFLLFFHQDVFRLFFGNKYDASIPLFVISLSVLPLRINHYTTILQTNGRANIILIGAVGDIVLTLILIIFLYPHIGIKSGPIAMVVATYVQAGFYILQSARALQLPTVRLLPSMIITRRLIITAGVFLILHLGTQSFDKNGRLAMGGLAVPLLAVAFVYKNRMLVWLRTSRKRPDPTL